MATKRVCDRCGAEINPISSATYCELTKERHDIEIGDIFELCVSCNMNLREWLKPLPPCTLQPRTQQSD